MKLTKDTVRTALALELTKVGCTLLDAEQFIKESGQPPVIKTAIDLGGAAKAIATLGGGAAFGLGAIGAGTGYGMYTGLEDSDAKERKKLVEIEQYKQAIRDLQAAQKNAPQF